MDEERANKIIQQIGSEIVSDPGVAEHDWESVAVVAWEDGQMSNFYGYRYLGDEFDAIEFENEDLLGLFKELREAMAEGEPRPWAACLYTIEQPDMDIDVDYEYDDPDRWQITPASFDTMPQQIRPG